MTNINPNDGINRVNNSFKREDIANNKEKPVAETKEVEGSSLNALSAYGKANITFRGTEQKQDEIIKEQVVQKLREIDIPENVKKNIGNYLDSPERILLANKLLSEPKLYENENIQDSIVQLFAYTQSKEGVNAKIKIIDKYLSSPDLYDNENIQKCIGDIIKHVNNEYNLKNGNWQRLLLVLPPAFLGESQRLISRIQQMLHSLLWSPKRVWLLYLAD